MRRKREGREGKEERGGQGGERGEGGGGEEERSREGRGGGGKIEGGKRGRRGEKRETLKELSWQTATQTMNNVLYKQKHTFIFLWQWLQTAVPFRVCPISLHLCLSGCCQMNIATVKRVMLTN